MRYRFQSTFSLKLNLSYWILLLLCVTIMGYSSQISARQAIKSNAEINIKGILQQMHDNILYKTSAVERISDLFVYDRRFHSIINSKLDNRQRYELMTRYVQPKFSTAMMMTPDDIRLRIYIDNETMPEFYYIDYNFENNESYEVDPLSRGRRYELFHVDQLIHQDWYIPEVFSEQDITWVQVGTDARYGNISLIRHLVDFQRMSTIGVITIMVKMEDLFHSVDYSKIGQGTFMTISSADGSSLYVSGNGQDIHSLMQDNNTGKEYLIITENIISMGYRLTAYVPLTRLEQEAEGVKRLILMLSIGSFISLALLSYLLSNSFSSQVRGIVASMNAFRQGDLSKRIAFTGNDEFGKISSSFNDMAQGMEELIEEVYTSNLQKKEIELQLLQSQINPHFLYNVLSLVSRLNKVGDTNRVQDITMKIALFYRLTLSQGETMVTIDKEIEQVKAYIDILNIQYKDGLKVKYQIDPDLSKYRTVNFILQPFIENIVKHAWYGDNIFVQVLCCDGGDHISIKVIDDGIGMRQEVIDRIFSSEDFTSGYGINNVHERIRIRFGEGYGIHITSRYGCGTTIAIKLPKYR